MTEDKRARLDEIKELDHRIAPEDYLWLITELEAAWGEVDYMKRELHVRRGLSQDTLPLRAAVEGYRSTLDMAEDVMKTAIARAEAAETQLSVLDGSSCGEEQLDGNGPCGICVFCLRDRAEAAEKRVKVLEEALESLLGISHRIEGCSDSDCLVCRENDRVIEQARAALSSKQMEEKP